MADHLSERGAWSLRVHAEHIPIGASGGIEGFTRGLVSGLTHVMPPGNIEVLVSHRSLDQWRESFEAIGCRPILVPVAGVAPGVQMPILSQVKKRLRRLRFAWWIRTKMRPLLRKAPATDPDRFVVDYFPFHRGRVFGKHPVVTVHDLRPFESPFIDIASQRNIRWNIEQSATVFTSWQHPEAQLRSLFPEVVNKLARVPFPVMQHATPITVANSNRRIVVYPAATAPHKNHAIIVKHAELFRPSEIKYVLVGPVIGDTGTALRREIAEKGLNEYIEVRGHVSADELNALYMSSWALLMPSLYEAASGPIMEAMGHSLPIVCADLEVHRSQMKECGGGAVWFDPQSPESLERAFAQLRQSYDNYRELSTLGGQWYSRLSWTKTAQNYVREIEGLLPRCLP